MNSHSLPEVRLRAIEPEDLDMLYHIENDKAMWNVGTTNVPYSRYTLHDYIANSSDDIYADRQVRLMIENADSKVVGMVDVVNFSPEHRRAEVGIVILDECRRKGYATSALQSIEDYSRDVVHLHQLYVVVEEINEASLKLFESVGYVRNMFLQDWLYDGKNYHNAIVMQKII